MKRMIACGLVLCGVVIMSGCASTQEVAADSLSFHASAEWVRQAPTHETRRLQIVVPSREEAIDDAEIVVWNFPQMRDKGDGEVIRRVIDRWCEQFTQADGTSSFDVARQRQYLINGLPAHTVDISGRYVAETSPGSGIRVDRPYYRMIGAYVTAPEGDYVIKFVGPASVVTANSEPFRTFLHSMRHNEVLQQDMWPTAHRRAELTAAGGVR
jgi:hypothetical protein